LRLSFFGRTINATSTLPLVKAYNSKLNWIGVVDILIKTGWADLLSMLPRKIRKQHNSKK
ncbi:hypothetical protein ACFLTE_10940, partial [Bacteroidota bacterium]